MSDFSYKYDGVKNIKFSNRDDAVEVLKRMKEICNYFGIVTVADFKDLIGEACDYIEDKYIWNRDDVNAAYVYSMNGSYYIEISNAIYKERMTDKTAKKEDVVNHPSHYKSKNGLETIDVIDAFTSDLVGTEAVCTANVLKYICRWKKKNGLQDLKKAKWYLEHLINHIEKEFE